MSRKKRKNKTLSAQNMYKNNILDPQFMIRILRESEAIPPDQLAKTYDYSPSFMNDLLITAHLAFEMIDLHIDEFYRRILNDSINMTRNNIALKYRTTLSIVNNWVLKATERFSKGSIPLLEAAGQNEVQGNDPDEVQTDKTDEIKAVPAENSKDVEVETDIDAESEDLSTENMGETTGDSRGERPIPYTTIYHMKQEMPAKEIAEIYNVSESTVQRWANKGKEIVSHDPNTIEFHMKIRLKYLSGKTIVEISKEEGVSDWLVRKWLKAADVLLQPEENWKKYIDIYEEKISGSKIKDIIKNHGLSSNEAGIYAYIGSICKKALLASRTANRTASAGIDSIKPDIQSEGTMVPETDKKNSLKCFYESDTGYYKVLYNEELVSVIHGETGDDLPLNKEKSDIDEVRSLIEEVKKLIWNKELKYDMILKTSGFFTMEDFSEMFEKLKDEKAVPFIQEMRDDHVFAMVSSSMASKRKMEDLKDLISETSGRAGESIINGVRIFVF